MTTAYISWVEYNLPIPKILAAVPLSKLDPLINSSKLVSNRVRGQWKFHSLGRTAPSQAVDDPPMLVQLVECGECDKLQPGDELILE